MSHSPRVHFVFSAPRSGSTWLTQALNAHPRILATENRLFGMFFEIWRNRNGRSIPRITVDKFIQGFSNHTFWPGLGFETAAELQADLFREWCDFLFSWLARRSGKHVIVDKITPYLGTSQLVLNRIAEYFPESRIIHLIRDGRDVVTSGIFDWIGRESSPQSKPREDFFRSGTATRLDRFFDDQSLRTWCQYWIEPIQAILESTHPQHGFLPIKFESMLDDHPKCLKKVFEFLNVDAGDSCCRACAADSTFEKTTGRMAGQNEPLAKARRGVGGDWVNYFTRQDARIFCQLAGATLVQQKYADDDSWADDCPEQLNLEGSKPERR